MRACSVVDTRACEAAPGREEPGWTTPCAECLHPVCVNCSLRIPDGEGYTRYCHQCLRSDLDGLGYRPLVLARVDMLNGQPVSDDLFARLADLGVAGPRRARKKGVDSV